MNNILSINPEAYVEKTESDFFQIVCITENDYRLWNGAGSINMIEGNGFLETKVFDKQNLVNEYYKALRFFKNEAQNLSAGKLEIIALPKFKASSGDAEIEAKDQTAKFAEGLNTKLNSGKY